MLSLAANGANGSEDMAKVKEGYGRGGCGIQNKRVV
jgi:hypothetical protein